MKLRVREEMKKKNISCAKLAELTGIKYRTLDEFLRRESGNFTNLVKIADALQLPIDSLIIRDDNYAVQNGGMESLGDIEEPDAESPISELDDSSIYHMLKNFELNQQENQPELAEQARDITKKIFTKFKSDISEADYLLNEDRGLALKNYAHAFLTATVSDVNDFKQSQFELLVDLCKELGDDNTIISLVTKYTSHEFAKNKKHLAVLATILGEYGYAEAAEACMKCILK